MIVVNLTTTFQRLDLCKICLVSLLMQKRQPDKVNLWVSDHPYLRDQGIEQSRIVHDLLSKLPAKSKELIDVRWVQNTGPYRKLIPMLREATDEDVIVTADDDIFYGENWLGDLLDNFNPDDNAAVATRVRLKSYNFMGRKISYLLWPLIENPVVLTDDYVVTFGGGAVLSKSMFRHDDIADDAFLKIAPTADDLWYSKLLRRNKIEVKVVPKILNDLYFIIHDEGLTNSNFPKISSLFDRVWLRVWNFLAGQLGISVCGNDVAYKNVEHYFRNK